jgi:quinol monooxygenase YgiN
MACVSVIRLQVKPGKLDEFTEVYRENPMHVITTKTCTSPLYILAHEGESQVTLVFYDSVEDRKKTQDSADLKGAVQNVKDSGLLGGPPSAVDFAIESDERHVKNDRELQEKTKSIVVGDDVGAKEDVLRKVTLRNAEKNQIIHVTFLSKEGIGAAPKHWFVR